MVENPATRVEEEEEAMGEDRRKGRRVVSGNDMVGVGRDRS